MTEIALMTSLEREGMHLLIERAGEAMAAAAKVLRQDGQHKITTDSDRGELGLAIGRLNATISQVMALGVPDRDFALKGMAQEQQRFRDAAARIGAR